MLATRTRARKVRQPAPALPRKAAATPSTAGNSAALFAKQERATIEKIFQENGLPGWVGWGIYGAESSYGKAQNSGFGFGLIEPSYNGKSPRAGQTYYNAEIAAELVSRLAASNPNGLAGAVVEYAGHEYTIAHLEELGKVGKAPSGAYAEEHPNAGPEALIEPGIGGISIPNPLSSVSQFIELITSGELWLRVAEVLGGVILIFLGLKGLTGAELPAVVPLPV